MANLKTDFSLSAIVNADTSKIQKTLNQNKYVLKADVDLDKAVSTIEKKIQTLNKRMADWGGKDLGERINRSMQVGVTGIDKTGKAFENCTKYVETFKTKLGDVTERVTVFTQSGKMLGQSTNVIANGIKKISTITTQATESINGLNGILTTVTKTTTDTAGNVTQVITNTKQWMDANNQLHTTVETLNGDNQQISATTETVVQATQKEINKFNELNGVLTETSQATTKTIKANGDIETVIESVDKSGQKLKTTISEIKGLNGEVTKTTKVYNETLGKTVSKHTETTKVVNNSVDAYKKLNSQVNQVNKETKTLGQTFASTVEKVTRFYLATMPMRAFQKAVSETIEVVKDFDSALTELRKVWDDSYGSMDKTLNKLSEIGSEVARDTITMTEIATGAVKAGFSSDKDIENIARVSALLQNTADEALTADEATSILTSQIRAYNMATEEAIKVTDILNAVSAKEAITSGGLAKGLQQASSALATYNNDIYQTTALITGGVTVLQGKSQQVKTRCLLNIA